jgi:hypothetical protein
MTPRLMLREIADMMGDPPPRDPEERRTYWRLALDRLWLEDPESYWDYVLLPGLLPAELWEHLREEADRATRHT